LPWFWPQALILVFFLILGRRTKLRELEKINYQTSMERQISSKKIVSNLAWVYVGSMIQAVAKLAVLACMTRLLTPEDFGLLGIALIFTSLAERLGQVGVGPALVQKAELNEGDLKAGLHLGILSGVMIAAALTLGAPWIADFFHAPSVTPVIQVLGLNYIIDGGCVVADSIMQRDLRFRDLMAIESLAYIFGQGVIGILLAYYGFGVWALVYSMLAARFIRAVMLTWSIPPVLGFRGAVPAAIQMTKLGVGFSLGRVLNFLSIQGDNFVVGRLLGVEALGMYTRGYQLMTLPANYLGQVLERVLFPAMARKQQQKKDLAKIFFGSLESVAIISLPASVAMYLLAPEVITVLFGKRWQELVPVLEILSFGIFFRTAYKCGDTLARAMGAVYRHAMRQIVYTVAVIGGCWIGGIQGGLQGVASAVVLAVGINYFLMLDLSRQFLEAPVKAFVQAHVVGTWLSLLLGVVLYVALPILRSAIPSSFLVLLIAACIGALIMFCGVFFSPPRLQPQLLAQVRPYLGRFKLLSAQNP